MILRSAILGLSLSIAIILLLVLVPQSTQDPFLEELRELALTEDQLPPVLYPMFPWDDTQPEHLIVLPPTLVKIGKDPKSREVSAGSTLTFRLTLENTSDTTLRNLTLEDRFDSSHLKILNKAGGTVEKNRISWRVPILHPKQVWRVNYSVEIGTNLPPSPIETTAYVFGKDIEDMTSTYRLASSTITIIEMPATGVRLPWMLRWSF